MGSLIKQGQSIFIPFVNGESVPDSQNRPRMYKTVEQFEKNSRVFHGATPILIEYVPVEKKHVWETEVMNRPFCRDITRVCECVCATVTDGSELENIKPLTLEELRKMDGKPVYYKTAKMWFIVALNHPDFGDCAINVSGQHIPLEKAARQNRFYASEPPRLDRSAWEPCEDCKEISYWDETCDNCKYDDLFSDKEPCASCKSKSKWEPYYSFCTTCGRPLTDAAWDMLEKRLEGTK